MGERGGEKRGKDTHSGRVAARARGRAGGAGPDGTAGREDGGGEAPGGRAGWGPSGKAQGRSRRVETTRNVQGGRRGRDHRGPCVPETRQAVGGGEERLLILSRAGGEGAGRTARVPPQPRRSLVLFVDVVVASRPTGGGGAGPPRAAKTTGLEGGNARARRKPAFRPSLMILPQVHLRKPCYDFYFL